MVAEESKPEPTKSPGELAVERAQFARTRLLSQMQGTWNHVCRELEAMGFSAYSGYALVAEGFARIDVELPEHVCPLCVLEELPKPRCLCRGRGYFTKREADQFALAKARAARAPIGDTRPASQFLRDLTKVLR